MGNQLFPEKRGLGLDLSVLEELKEKLTESQTGGLVGDYATGKITQESINQLSLNDRVKFALVVSQELSYISSTSEENAEASLKAAAYFTSYAQAVSGELKK